MRDKLAGYFRCRVEIRANGIEYRGLLVGADEEVIYLIGPSSWITIPLEAVSAVRREGERDWDRRRIEGEPALKPEAREPKKIYSPSDVEKLHSGQGAENWPEWSGDDGEDPEGGDAGSDNAAG